MSTLHQRSGHGHGPVIRLLSGYQLGEPLQIRQIRWWTPPVGKGPNLQVTFNILKDFIFILAFNEGPYSWLRLFLPDTVSQGI